MNVNPKNYVEINLIEKLIKKWVFWESYLQCFSTLLLSAIFSPVSVQTGWVNTILAKSALTASTRPPVDNDPMLTISTSFFDNFCT